MRKLLLPCLAVVAGCGGASSYVRSDQSTLGHIVIYRNGVAYFERYAEIADDTLTLQVPADKVDDFLKSLTVVDARTGQPAPIAYPTAPPHTESGLMEMKISLPGPRPHQLKISYVTESPSWKPSYRLVLGKSGTVGVQGWAIVDNTSGEDWKNVKLGVGSSSAMSFRFDLRSLRLVQRETLQSNDLFALAPPIGGATYDNKNGDGKRILGSLSDEAIAMNDRPQPKPEPVSPTPPTSGDFGTGVGTRSSGPHTAGLGGGGGGGGRGLRSAPTKTTAPFLSSVAPPDPLGGVVQSLRGKQVIIEGYADAKDQDKNSASLARANRVREQLLRRGLDPNQIVAVGRGEASGRASGVNIVENTAEAAKKAANPAPGAATLAQAQVQAPAGDPIGTSHFESTAPMSVARGTSAMVSILDGTTEGEVVYLFDAESMRGNSTFAFKSVRIKNPTDSVLESGPVTVFGDGRFIGEGLSEPIPARSVAFVPFALDRQIVVESSSAERDEIARVITVQRGVFSTELEHIRKSTLLLHNRMDEKATVYVRHTVAPGYKLSAKSPPVAEKIGGAQLFKVELAPHGKTELLIEEQSPLYKTTDIRTPGGMEMVRVFLSSAAGSGPLKSKMAELLKLEQEMGNTEQHINTMREQMGEYKDRMNELHAQIVTLRAVRTGGPLMRDLEKKLGDISDKLSKSTVALVTLEEQMMVSRIHFQDGVADLSLDPHGEAQAEN